MTSFYPTCIRNQATDIWLGWISPDVGSDHYFALGSRVVWAADESQLVKYLQSEQSLRRESETTFFDVDALTKGLTDGVVINADLAFNLWNLFGDLQNTVCDTGADADLFCGNLPGSLKLYDRLFSLSTGGEVLEIEKQALSRADVELLQTIVERGSRFLWETVSFGVEAISA